MHHLPRAPDAPSLDDVVQQTLHHSSAASTSTPTSTAIHAALTQLADPESPLSNEFNKTTAVQALHRLCSTFVEHYRAPDALLLDTAWWSSEAARLRRGDPSNDTAPSKMLPSSTPTVTEREELLLRAAQLLRATHRSNTPSEVCSTGTTADRTWYMKTTTAATAGASPSHPQHRDDSGEINVLQFDEQPLTLGQESNWESLELMPVTDMQRSDEMQGQLRKEEECMRVLDNWIVSALKGKEKGGNANEHVEAFRVESLEYVLHQHPEMVTRHEELSTLQHLVAASTCRNPSGRWTATALTLFQALLAPVQLDFMRHILASLRETGLRTGESAGLLMTFVLQLLNTFAECWLPLLDSEITDIFLGVVSCVVIPFASALDKVDPEAAWLTQWCMRPSFVLVIGALIDEHPGVVRELCTVVKSSSHAACVLLHILPYMCRRSEGCTAGVVPSLSLEDAAAENGSVTETQEASWVALFHHLQRVLSESPAGYSHGVYELGSCALCTCVAQLPLAEKERCAARLTDVLSQWRPLRREGAAAEDPLCFSFQLLTELLCVRSDKEPWCSTAALEFLDVSWRTQLQATATANAAAAAPRAAPSPLKAAKTHVLSRVTLEVLQRCWTRILCCHACRMPQSLAALVEDVVAPCAGAPSKSARLFTWQTLIAVSSTLSGWSALQPHLLSLSGGLAPSSGRWTALLPAILEFSQDAALSPVRPVCSTDARTPPSAQKPSKLKGSREPRHRHVSFCSPRCVALCLRWSTVAEARAGLVVAARDAARYFLHRVKRSERNGSGGRDGTRDAWPAEQWPLLWPVEAYPHAGHADLSYNEDTAAGVRNVQSLACYQSLAIFFTCTALPLVGKKAATDGDTADASDDVWRQLEDLWLSPSQLLHEGTAQRATSSSPPSILNHPPFEEDSLLTLLCALTLCILIRPLAEYKAGLSPDAAQQRLRPLRRLCVARRGVDPAYFMVRFITSGKGRKRLPAILLDGYEAELTVDTLIDLSDFTEGEDLPAGEAAQPVTERAVSELLIAAFPTVEPTEGNWRSADRREENEGGSSGDASKPSWPPGLVALVRTLLGHPSALRTSPAALKTLLASRTINEWSEFMQRDKRALAVSKILEASHPTVFSILRAAHVEVVYLASLCVSCWLWLPATHITSARRKLFWAALQYFSHHGVAAHDGYVACSLAAHVERLHRESVSNVEDAVIFPQSRPLPLPSPLFVLLLVKPFALAMR